MSFCSATETATIDIDRDSEFTGDDADQFSSLVNFDQPYRWLQLIIPTITSSAITLYTQEDDLIATVPVLFHHGYMYDASGAGNAWTTAAWTTTAGTGACTIAVDLGQFQFIRVRCTTNQGADRAILLRGIK